MLKQALLAATLTVAAAGHASAASVSITEWLYDGNGGEFVEFTNTSGATIDFTGWRYDDDSRSYGAGFDLSGFGLVAAGESVLISEVDANTFRTQWNLDASVKVLGGYTNNLGRNDEINLFDSAGTLIDRLTYGDQDFPGTIRTQRVSGSPVSADALGSNDISLWVLSSVGDAHGSYLSLVGDIGNPGQASAVPLPAAAWFFLSGLAGLAGVARRRAA
jgi:predicted extracellular nuclease